MSVDDPNDLIVAYDDTDASRAAAEFAAERAAETGETVDVVHVGHDLSESDIKADVGEAFAARDVEAGYHVVPAGGSDDENVSVRAALSRVITHSGHDMVFVGNEEYGLFDDIAKKSVSDALITEHRVPVVLVPDDD